MSLYDGFSFLVTPNVYALGYGDYSDHCIAAVCPTKEQAEWTRLYLCAVAATVQNFVLLDEVREAAKGFAKAKDLEGLLNIVKSSGEAKRRYAVHLADLKIEELCWIGEPAPDGAAPK